MGDTIDSEPSIAPGSIPAPASAPPIAPAPISPATSQALAERQAAILRDFEAINRVRILMGDPAGEAPFLVPPAPTPRPSMAVQAAVKAGGLSKKVFAVLGGIAFAAEMIARLWPTASHYITPLQAILAALQSGPAP